MSGRVWEKILYENQGYPDNYTNKETFLQDLRTNTNIKKVTLFEGLKGALNLLEEFCTVIGFVLVYVYLYNELVEPNVVLQGSVGTSLCGYIFYTISYSEKIRFKIGNDVKTVLIFMVFGHLFSPILHTLTDTISTDTIYTMTFFMMLIHLIFFDYGVNAAIVLNSLSMSAAIFASICLASRLASPYHAFILISVAIELFVLFPLIRKKIQNPIYITPLLFGFDSFLLMEQSILFATIFFMTVIFINYVCPILFVSYQKHKKNIYGPWDEAVVEDADKVIHNLIR